MKPFWISFATVEQPLGVALVEGENHEHALREATRLGFNPGGEAQIYDMSVAPEARAEVEKWGGCPRFLSVRELDAVGQKHTSQLTDEEKKYIREHAPGVLTVCQACNEGHCKEHNHNQ